jgi:hypothetical protein
MAPNPDTTEAGDKRGHRFGLLFLRYGLAVTLAVLGVIGLIAGHGHTAVAGAGVVLLGVAAMVWMLNWLLRLGLASNEDRVQDEQARDYFSEHGHWPEEGDGG